MPITKEKKFTYAFQPILNLNDQTIHHYEALMRASNPKWSTGDLIRLIEATGAIGDLDRNGVSEIAETTKNCIVPIAVNVSGASVLDHSFHTYVFQILSAMKDPGRLYFEITETHPITHLPSARGFVRGVQAFGAQVAIDDYGAGFMGPKMLEKLGVNVVKIDMSIIQNLTKSDKRSEAKQFVRNTMGLAESVGARVLAEGISSPALLLAVQDLGITLGQGFHLGKPSPLPASASLWNKVASQGYGPGN